MSQIVLYTAGEVAEILRLNQQVVQRKLQAGDIPGYRLGREWRVEHSQLIGWLEQHSNRRRSSDAAKVLRAFLDEEGRLRSIPVSQAKRAVVLEHLAGQLEADRTYRERELSGVLRQFHDDVATLRRELVGAKLLVRTTDGVYKLAARQSARRPTASTAGASRATTTA
jgi:excisionase family DNA binding protein